MIRWLLLTLALLATPATADTCKPGQRKLHGKCVPARVIVPEVVAPGVNGAVRIKADVTGKLIGPLIVRDAYRAVETDAGVDTPDIVIRDLTATGLTRDGIRLRNAPGALIERFDLRHAEAPSEGEHLPEGIAIYAGIGITIRDGRGTGFRMVAVPGRYTNGGVVSTEGGTGGTIQRVVATDSSEGFDLKGKWTADAIVAERTGRGLRGWHNLTVGTYTSRDNATAVWLGKGAIVTIKRLIASSGAPAQVFVLEGSTRLTVETCDLTGMAPGSVLVKSNGSRNVVTLGLDCHL